LDGKRSELAGIIIPFPSNVAVAPLNFSPSIMHASVGSSLSISSEVMKMSVPPLRSVLRDTRRFDLLNGHIRLKERSGDAATDI